MDKNIKKYLSKIGSRGGKKSRRHLDSKEAKKMVRLREARRAFKNNFARCFWSYDPDLLIRYEDIPWVSEQLMKNGDRKLWELGVKLCH